MGWLDKLSSIGRKILEAYDKSYEIGLDQPPPSSPKNDNDEKKLKKPLVSPPPPEHGEEEEEANTVVEPPDGGLIAWLQVLSGFIIFFNTMGLVNTFGTFQAYYLSYTLSAYSSTQVSWIGSLQACLLFFVGVVAGPLYDLGYLRHLLIAGGFFSAFGMMMTSLCTSYWQFILAQGLCIGIGSGCLFVCCMAVVGQWFSTKRAVATGIEACGGAVGGVIYPIIFTQLYPHIGFPWAVRVMGFVILATSVIPVVLMRPLLPPSSVRSLLPTRASFDGPFTLWLIGLLFAFTVLYNVSFYILLYAESHSHLAASFGVWLLVILNGASIPGRLILTRLGDVIGCVNTMIIFAALAGMLAFCWIAAKSLAGIIVFVVFYGMIANTFSSLPGPATVSLSTSIEGLGTRMTASLVVSGLGVLIGPPIAGAILQSPAGWVGLQCWSGALLLLGAACMMASRVVKVGWSIKEKA